MTKRLKNKGFTLIEVLGVISILAVIVAIVFPNIGNIKEVVENHRKEVTKKNVLKAAKTFSSEVDEEIWVEYEDDYIYCITVRGLIHSGYFKNDEIPEIGSVDELSKDSMLMMIKDADTEVVDEIRIDSDNICKNNFSSVDLKVAGTYPVVYVAEDYAGNKTKATANVIVKERIYSEEEVNSLADKVLSKIIKAGMTPYEKAEAIYYYTRNNIRYISDSQKDDWVRAAFEGLVDKKGDCYVYACTAKVLLTRAGITNMDIEKIPAKTRHYWNLVDIGNGWYHFDTTPRIDGTIFFMWNENDLMNYSVKNDNSHNYDHSLYPTVN